MRTCMYRLTAFCQEDMTTLTKPASIKQLAPDIVIKGASSFHRDQPALASSGMHL